MAKKVEKKKLSTNQKGDILEKAVEAILAKHFRFVEGPPVKVRFTGRDYFSLFDFLIVDRSGSIIGIQVSMSPIYDKNRKFKQKWKLWPGKKIYCSDPNKLIEQLEELGAFRRL